MADRFDPLFGALVEGSGWFPSPAHVMRRAAILEMIRDCAPGRLLDIGCGAGRWLVDWHRLGHTGLAVEPDAASRALARDCAERFGARFEISGVFNEAEPESYDYMTAFEVLEHIEDPLAALREWSTRLKPGGVLVASVPAFRRLWGRSDEWAGHVQRFEPEQFRTLVEAAGYVVEDCRVYGFPVARITRMFGNIASWLKQRGRSAADNERVAATLASGRDRSAETKLGPLLSSPFAAAALRLGVALQRRFRSWGIGVIIRARKLPAAQARHRARAAA